MGAVEWEPTCAAGHQQCRKPSNKKERSPSKHVADDKVSGSVSVIVVVVVAVVVVGSASSFCT